jgi:RND family efflux transporter MFP subunit
VGLVAGTHLPVPTQLDPDLTTVFLGKKYHHPGIGRDCRAIVCCEPEQPSYARNRFIAIWRSLWEMIHQEAPPAVAPDTERELALRLAPERSLRKTLVSAKTQVSWFAAVLFVGGIVLSSESCSRPPKVEANVVKDSDASTVAVAKATMEDLSRDLVLTAEFRPFQEVDIMAKVAGYVKTLYVDVGDRVKQGQLLAILEIPEMADDRTRAQAGVDRSQAEVARARDQIQQAQSAHEIAHLSYTRLAEVFKQKPGLVAQQEIDDAHSKDLVSEAQLSAARSNLDVAEHQVQVNMAELQKVKTLFDYTSVTAPFAGVVTKRYADTGSMIQAGTSSSSQAMPLVRLSENGLLRLILPVPESAVSTVHIGQQVEIRVPTMNRNSSGRVARFSNKVAVATRTMDTEVDVPNPDLALIPGMYAEVHLTLDRRVHTLTVPVSAVDVGSDPSSGQVAVITPGNLVENRQVKLGLETATRVEVKSGLKEGEMVVIGNRSGLQPRQEVRPKVTTMSPSAPG